MTGSLAPARTTPASPEPATTGWPLSPASPRARGPFRGCVGRLRNHAGRRSRPSLGPWIRSQFGEFLGQEFCVRRIEKTREAAGALALAVFLRLHSRHPANPHEFDRALAAVTRSRVLRGLLTGEILGAPGGMMLLEGQLLPLLCAFRGPPLHWSPPSGPAHVIWAIGDEGLTIAPSAPRGGPMKRIWNPCLRGTDPRDRRKKR